MTPFSSIALFLSIVVCGISTSVGATHYPTVYYVTERCGSSVSVHGDIRIKLARSTYLSPNLQQCSLVFEPNSATQVTAKFLSYNMNPAYTNEYGICPYESIQLYDAYRNSRLSPNGDDYCSWQRPSITFYLDNSGRFTVNSGQYSQIITADVDLLISEVTPKSAFFNSTCPNSKFDCGNGYCVPKEVTCNGFDDCGNNADEDAVCESSLSTGVIAAIVVGVVFIIVIAVIVSLLFRRYRRRAGYTQPK